VHRTGAAVRAGRAPYVVGFYLVPQFPMMAFASAIEPLRAANPDLLICFDTVDVNHVREYRHARVSGNVNILRRALARLFKEEKDPITVIKWKEIYENIENATDRCEDVANIIEGVVLENA